MEADRLTIAARVGLSLLAGLMAAALIGVARPELRQGLLMSWRQLGQSTRLALTTVLLSLLVGPAIVIVVILFSSLVE
jgi:hypothetical protein